MSLELYRKRGTRTTDNKIERVAFHFPSTPSMEESAWGEIVRGDEEAGCPPKADTIEPNNHKFV